MKVDEKRSDRADGRTTTYRRSAVLAVLVAVTAGGLAACGGSSTPQVASLAKSTVTTGSSTSGSSASKLAKHDPTRLVDEWAACERSHGDPGQADPTIDSHGVINITMPPLGEGGPVGDPHGVTGTCSDYLAAAQRALRAAMPVRDPLGMDNQADLLKYVNCMRASGVPNYPYPTGNTTNFNGTGVDPNSPFVTKISIRCGNKLGLPLWWSAGWGPPGDVSVSMTQPPGASPPGPLVSATGASHGGQQPGPPVSGANGGSGTNG
jgi:hypothetical protein